MLTIDEYIAKMKKADKLNEFDYLKISENLSAVMKYVMSYFNEYLTMETCDAEEIKFKHAADKLQEEIERRYPKSKEFILCFYLQHRIRIHKELEKWANDIQYFTFFYSDDDFSSLAKEFCTSYKLNGANMNKYCNETAILLTEIKGCKTNAPSPSDMFHLDNNIVSWVLNTYRQYGVNLYDFASDHAYSYYRRYVQYERDDDRRGQGYYVNNYNHRYNKNSFDIDQVYEDNKHRPYLENRRGELEMLVMHEWLFTEVYDDDYWPEYVNLCIAHGRVHLAENVNALMPVTITGLTFPNDVPCSIEHIVSTDGVLKKVPQESYIFRVDFNKTIFDSDVKEDDQTAFESFPEKKIASLELLNLEEMQIEQVSVLHGLDLIAPESREYFNNWLDSIAVPGHIINYDNLISSHKAETEYREARDKAYPFREDYIKLYTYRDKINDRNNISVIPIVGCLLSTWSRPP